MNKMIRFSIVLVSMMGRYIIAGDSVQEWAQNYKALLAEHQLLVLKQGMLLEDYNAVVGLTSNMYDVCGRLLEPPKKEKCLRDKAVFENAVAEWQAYTPAYEIMRDKASARFHDLTAREQRQQAAAINENKNHSVASGASDNKQSQSGGSAYRKYALAVACGIVIGAGISYGIGAYSASAVAS